MRRRKSTRIVRRRVVGGSSGPARLEPALRRFSKDADPEVARAAQDGLRILAAQQQSS
jgi:hypothetical protein